MTKILLPILIAALIFSCKKSTTPPTPTPTDTCKITAANVAGTYLKTAVTYKASSTTAPQDEPIEDCKKDDLYQLKTDGTVVIDENTNVCSGPPPPGTISSWYLDNNNTVLVLGAFLTIDTFNCKRLVVTEHDSFVSGDSKTTTFVKQ